MKTTLQKSDSLPPTSLAGPTPSQNPVWTELHSSAPPVAHPIPRLDLASVPLTRPAAKAHVRIRAFLRSYRPVAPCLHFFQVTVLAFATLWLCGCQSLTYTSPNGEHFSRTSLASTTSLSSLTVETDTNGIRRVELHGYTNDSSQALGAVTEAAVRAALQSAK